MLRPDDRKRYTWPSYGAAGRARHECPFVVVVVTPDASVAEWEAARLLTLKAAWMADNRIPNSLEASMAKAKAGRVVTEVTLRCVELAGPLGYGEGELLENWARDAKILDIFEGTQQIQMLIVARRVLEKSSAELK